MTSSSPTWEKSRYQRPTPSSAVGVRIATTSSASASRARAVSGAQLGMLVAHTGIGIFILGVTAVKGFETEQDLRMHPGEVATVGGYTLRFDGVRDREGPNYSAARGTLQLLRDGKLDMGHARALLALPALKQIDLAREAVARQLSVRQVEKRVAGVTARPAARGRARIDRDVARLEDELSGTLGTSVSIRAGAKPGSGKLVIHYSSLDQLDALLTRLRQK